MREVVTHIIQEADRGNGNAAILGFGERLTIQGNGVPCLLSSTPRQAPTGPVEGYFASIFAQTIVPSIEECIIL